MIEITNGTKTLKVPDATAQATLKERWLKKWTIVKHVGNAPQEVIQFQQAKLQEQSKGDVITTNPEHCKAPCRKDVPLESIPIRRLGAMLQNLTREQLEGLKNDPRKSVQAMAERQLTRLNDSGK